MFPSSATSPTRLPIMLSALVYPGAGQLVQKRWIAATAYILTFTVGLALCVWQFIRILMAYISTADFDAPVRPPPGYKPLLAWVGVSLLLYGASLVDTILAQQRARQCQSNARLPPPLPQA